MGKQLDMQLGVRGSQGCSASCQQRPGTWTAARTLQCNKAKSTRWSWTTCALAMTLVLEGCEIFGHQMDPGRLQLMLYLE